MKMRTTVSLSTLALFICLTGTPALYAATATTTFNVTATVPTSCSVSAGGDLAFGSYTGTQIDATTTVSITCTNGTAYTAGLDDGLNYSAPNRRMANGTAYLNYELYSDSGRTTRWGNATGSWVSDTGTGSAQSKTVYGRLAGSQTLVVGSYTDTITVTITY
jgi:spore coat protein U-like protein